MLDTYIVRLYKEIDIIYNDDNILTKKSEASYILVSLIYF